MTTIVSRLYDERATAEAAAEALRAAGHDPRTIRLVASENTASQSPATEGPAPAHPPTERAPSAYQAALRRRIVAAGVGSTSAAVYADEVARGCALLVVRAPFTPFGRAREAMRIVDRFAPMDVPGVNANQHIRDYPNPANFNTILRDHPRWFAGDIPPLNPRRRAQVSTVFGLPMLSRRRPAGTTLRTTLSQALRLPLVLRSRGGRALPTGRFASRWFWPLPLLSGKPG